MTAARDETADTVWLVATLGEEVRPTLERSRAVWSGMSAAERQEHAAALAGIEAALVGAMEAGAAPGDDRVRPLIERHRAWVGTLWGGVPEPRAYAGLADVYESHPEFAARFESLAPGFTGFLADAMRAHAD